MTKLKSPTLGPVKVICAYCDRIFQINMTSNPQELLCPLCGRRSNILLATIRGKHSREGEWNFKRYFVRIITSEGEKEIMFADGLNRDMPLRSGDDVAFYYSHSEPKVILRIFNASIRQTIVLGVFVHKFPLSFQPKPYSVMIEESIASGKNISYFFRDKINI